MTIATQERQTYQEAWSLDAYAAFSPGERFLDVFRERAVEGATVIDAGCGQGKGTRALVAAGYRVTPCDLVIPDDYLGGVPFVETCLWHDLAPVADWAGVPDGFDYVYCCDVLEHIPPPFTMLVVRNLLAVTTHAALLSISLVPDVFGAWVGKPLHQTVQSFTAWRDQLAEVGRVLEARDLIQTGVYWVAPR